MKKIISILLTVAMIITMAVPAFAGADINQTRSQIPLIRISGDGEALYDSEGNKVFHYKDIAKVVKGEEIGGNTIDYKAMAKKIVGSAGKGLLTGDWDDLYADLETEISKIFANSLLDVNGDVTNGSGISQNRKNQMADKRANDKKGNKGYYAWDDYWFHYDWRLDPMETADEFHSYVQDIKKTTGSEKVGIIATCLGTNIVMAYVAKYGVSDIQGIAVDGSVVGGAEILSEVICAKFDVDANAVTRVLKDVVALDLIDIDAFVLETLDLLVETGLIERIITTTENLLYDKLVKGVTSALALSTFYTWPNYWACVSPEDYEDAKYYVFGEEGSEKRIKYAGLIEKLDNYDTQVRQRVPEVIKSIKDGGANFGAISKYGFQIIPICATSAEVSDQFATVARSSFGATTASIYDTLSDEYIAERQAQGKGKYISPDKLIDASTCLYPDYTWFIKGSSHSKWTSFEVKIMYDIASFGRQLTIDDFPYSQFMVYSYDDDSLSPMTEENCNTENWEADRKTDEPKGLINKTIVSFKAFVSWFVAFMRFVSAKISEKAPA